MINEKIDLEVVLSVFKSLLAYFQNLRNVTAEDTVLDDRSKLRVEHYNILDNILNEVQSKLNAYENDIICHSILYSRYKVGRECDEKHIHLYNKLSI